MGTMKRPVIGITLMNVQHEGQRALQGVRPMYVEAIAAAGGVPLLIPLTDDEAITRELYALCDGILLPGGEDLDPATYGEAPHPELGAVDPQRDAVELLLARLTRDDHKPLLGICRGMQTINVAFGGTLYQDLPSQLADPLNHRANTEMNEFTTPTHSVQLEADSWLARQLGTTEIAANTMHHQAVKAVAPGLRITGVAPDGVIEAVEGTDAQFVVGVQCHPEYLWHTSEPRWRAMFAGFVAVCGRPGPKHQPS
jgi:putative glutamine amidotransferase